MAARALLAALVVVLAPFVSEAICTDTDGCTPPPPRATCATECPGQCEGSCVQAGPNGMTTRTCADWLTSQTGVDNDGDGRLWSSDNCDCSSNANQADCDGDHVGDVCDSINGIYRADPARFFVPCYVRKAQHFLYYDVEVTWETRYLDSSTCRGPVLWDKQKVRNRVFSYGATDNEFEATCRRMVPLQWGFLCIPPNLDRNLCQNNGDTWPY